MLAMEDLVMAHRLNIRIAGRLRQMADLLEHQGEAGFRSRAYRNAAPVVEGLGRPVDEILSEEGREALVALPSIGQGIASAIA
jgi:DNA polymerase/3'-5' exonuclease PolX